MILKRIMSGVTAAAMAAMTLVGAGLSVSAGNVAYFPYDEYDITAEEVENSAVKPTLSISKTELTYEEAKGQPIVTVSVSVDGASGCYSSFMLHFWYDERLKLIKDEKGKFAKAGDAIEGEFYTGGYILSDSRFFCSGAAGGNKGLDGTLFSFDFELPEDVKPGDEFPIKFEYYSDEGTEDQFASSPNNRDSKLMNAWVFTHGLDDGYIRIKGSGDEHVKGDCNLDGYVDLRDASLMLSEFARVSSGRPETFTEEQKKVSDINGDGILTPSDASIVVSDYVQRLAGKESTVLGLEGSSYLENNIRGGFTDAEILDSAIKPELKMSAEITEDNKLELSLGFENTCKTKMAFGFVLNYDKRLTILSENHEITYEFEGISNMCINEEEHKIAVCALESRLDPDYPTKIVFALPEEHAAKEVYEFSVDYSEGSFFTDSEFSKEGNIMQAYFFAMLPVTSIIRYNGPVDDPDSFPYKKYGITKEQVEESPVNPSLSISRLEIDDKSAKNEVQTVDLVISGADRAYNEFSLCISYDPRMELVKNEDGEYFTQGDATAKMMPSEKIVGDGLICISGMSVGNVGLDGIIGSLSFRLPDDSKASDEFLIACKYIDNDTVTSCFKSNPDDLDSKLMNAWLFTKGLYDGYIKVTESAVDRFEYPLDKYGLTEEQVKNSPVKPVLNVSRLEISENTAKDSPVQRISLSVSEADKKYGNFGFYIYFDPRLTIEENEDGNMITVGSAISKMMTKEVLISDGVLYFSGMSTRNAGLDGVIGTIDFRLPQNAKSGDKFPIEVIYLNVDDSSDNTSCFSAIPDDLDSKLMQAWLFTNGIENGYIEILKAPYEYGIYGESISIHSYTGNDEDVSIPSEIDGYPVTGIHFDAFYQNETLKQVTIPEGVKSIGDCAFYGCKELSSVTIPESVTSIGKDCFKGCSSSLVMNGHKGSYAETYAKENGIKFNDLSGAECDPDMYEYEVWKPDDVKYAYVNKYNGTSENVVIPSEIDGLPVRRISGAFKNNITLKSVVVPEGCDEIGGTFEGCTSLESVELSGTVKYIGNYAFENCTSLKEIDIPDSVTSISSSAFEGCTALENVNFSKNIHYIGYNAFKDTKWLEEQKKISPFVIVNDVLIDGTQCVGDIVIPDSVNVISEHAFDRCSGITSVKIPDGVERIESYTFRECSSLTEVTISGSVKDIWELAFYDCKALKKVTLLYGVEDIYDGAFCGCDSLESFIIPASVTSIGLQNFDQCSENFVIIGNPGSYAETYAKENGINFKDINTVGYEYKVLDNGTAEITGYSGTFENLFIPTELDGHKVTKIGDNAFKGNEKLGYVSIPDSVTSIGEKAFYGCSSVTSISIPESVESIGAEAFAMCSNLRSINLPEGLTKISDGLFSGCSSLEALSLFKNVVSIGSSAFSGCGSLRAVFIPESAAEIGGDCFKDCSENFYIIGYAGSYAEKYAEENSIKFEGISKGDPFIDYIVLDDFTIMIIKYIGVDDDLAVPSEINGYLVTKIGYEAFAGSDFKTVTIPEGITEIHEYAFADCASLKSVVIPDSVCFIGGSSFEGCPKFTMRGLPGSYAEAYAKEHNIPFGNLTDTGVYGDIDGDGKISAYDASLVLTEYTMRAGKKPSVITDEQAKLADIDGDGKISAYDASLILSFYTYRAGKGTETDILKWYAAQSK